MKTITIIFILFTNTVFACDFSKEIEEIKSGPNKGKFIYSSSCNKEVGRLYKENKIIKKEVAVLKENIKTKELTLKQLRGEITEYRRIAIDNTERLHKVRSLQNSSNMIYFGLGILATSLSVYTAKELIDRR